MKLIMNKIEAIKLSKGRTKRLQIKLLSGLRFSLAPDVAIKEGLKVGQELSEIEITQLIGADHLYRCYNAALKYLSYRNRSEAETKKRLEDRGFDHENIKAVISKLKEHGLIDDFAFAQFWQNNRETFSPRSRWLTKLELRQKGVADDIIDTVVCNLDDNDNAYRAAVSKATHLPSDQKNFQRRLSGYLQRRGFSYDVIRRTVQRVWQEGNNLTNKKGV
jgi:regulatory protein